MCENLLVLNIFYNINYPLLTKLNNFLIHYEKNPLHYEKNPLFKLTKMCYNSIMACRGSITPGGNKIKKGVLS